MRRAGKNAEKMFEVAKDAKITRPALDRKTPEVKLTLDELKTAVKVTAVMVTVTHEGGKGVTRYWVVAVDALGQEGQPSSPVWHNQSYKGFFSGEWHQ